MPTAPAMQSLQARVDSFKKTKRVKRYPNKKQSTPSASVKWPHPSTYKANADTLAEAGFFFTPSWEDRDCVECFLCGKELSDWDPADDPFEIHYTKCRDVCPWAVVRCGLTEDMDAKGNFTFANKARLPTSKAMEEARLKTFGEDWWPHDGGMNHGANSKKMAQAGFVYTPQVAGDDTVTCLYCNLALGGWDKDDDPIHEHRKRANKPTSNCPFFTVPATKSSHPESSRSKESGKKSAPVVHKRTVSRTRSRKQEEAREPEKHPSLPPNPPIDEVIEQTPAAPTPGPLLIPEKPLSVLPVSDSMSIVETIPQPLTVAEGEDWEPSPPSPAPVVPSAIGEKAPIPPPPPNPALQKALQERVLRPPLTPPNSTMATVMKDGIPEPPLSIPFPQPEGVVEQPNLPSLLEAPQELMIVDEIPKPPSPIPLSQIVALPSVLTHPPAEPHLNSSVGVKSEIPVPGSDPQMMEGMQIPDALVPMLPPSHLLTEEEREMSLEEWIRREISLGYDKLMADGQGQISLFKERAAEIRKLINEL